MEWKDVSTHSRGTSNREPNAWRISAGGLSLTIHRHIYHKPDDWLMTFSPWYEAKLLTSKEVGEAKAEALAKARAVINAAVDAFDA